MSEGERTAVYAEMRADRLLRDGKPEYSEGAMFRDFVASLRLSGFSYALAQAAVRRKQACKDENVEEWAKRLASEVGHL